MEQKKLHFSGPAYEPQHDRQRLSGQIQRVYDCIKDGCWRTVQEIAAVTRDPETSVSSQLRNLRKAHFGGFDIEGRYRGKRKHAMYEYRLRVPKDEYLEGRP